MYRNQGFHIRLKYWYYLSIYQQVIGACIQRGIYDYTHHWLRDQKNGLRYQQHYTGPNLISGFAPSLLIPTLNGIVVI